MIFCARNILLGGCVITTSIISGFSFNAAMAAGVAPPAQFPDGVSPSNVYATMDLVERTADALLMSMHRRTPPPPKSFETSLQPMHVYQLAAATASRVQAFAEAKSVVAPDRIEVAPKKYFPRDVKKLADTMLSELRAAGAKMNVSDLPQTESEFAGKTPSDVYQVVMHVFVKASVLVGNAKITPNDVYAEMATAAAVAKSIVEHTGESFNEDFPKPEPKRKPVDVFNISLEARGQINAVRKAIGLSEISINHPVNGYRIRPIDVFVQSQLILAELNMVKMEIGMTTPAPKPVKVSGKTPTDVWGQVSLTRHLLSQLHQDKLAAVKD